MAALDEFASIIGAMEDDSMRPRERRDSGQNDLFKARLDQIVDLNHPLAKLARTVDWRFLEERFGAVYSDGSGQLPLPTAAIAATTRRPIIASRSISQARNGASPNTSSASCADVPQSNPSSATPKASIAWAAITSPANKATRSTSSSPPPDTTSEGCWHGSQSFCPHS
jgi:hypothetical protein